MAHLSTEFSDRTMDNSVSERLCIPCNPLRRAGFETSFHRMDRPNAAVKGLRRNAQRGSRGTPVPYSWAALEALPLIRIEMKIWLCSNLNVPSSIETKELGGFVS